MTKQYQSRLSWSRIGKWRNPTLALENPRFLQINRQQNTKCERDPFQLAKDSTVTARIYDVTGKQIRIIELGHIAAGNYVEVNKAIYWDGRTENGEQVSSGTYFYQIKAGDYTETRKMVILK